MKPQLKRKEIKGRRSLRNFPRSPVCASSRSSLLVVVVVIIVIVIILRASERKRENTNERALLSIGKFLLAYFVEREIETDSGSSSRNSIQVNMTLIRASGSESSGEKIDKFFIALFFSLARLGAQIFKNGERESSGFNNAAARRRLARK
jgi:hypothetical protein